MASVRLGSRRIYLPGNRLARIAIGVVMILAGMVGFLPILGFWMAPLGLLVLSVDLPAVRRLNRRITVWAVRTWNSWRGRGKSRPKSSAA
jgi:hypothetical protein